MLVLGEELWGGRKGLALTAAVTEHHRSIRPSDHLRSTESPLALTLTAVTTPAGENKQREEVAPWTTDARMVGCSDGQMMLGNKASMRQFLGLFKSFIPNSASLWEISPTTAPLRFFAFPVVSISPAETGG